MAKKEVKQILTKYIEGKTSGEEESKINGFYESFQESEFDWNSPGISDKENVKNDIWNRVREGKSHPHKQITILNQNWVKVAAAVILLITSSAIFFFLSHKTSDIDNELVKIETGYGETKTVVLPDSTVIQLNVGSELAYYQPFRNNKREIDLKGEAFFKVTKDPEKPFVVYSNHLTTTVLGTSFNITSYVNETEYVTVSSGKVKVEFSSIENKSIQLAYLEAGQQAFTDQINAKLVKQIAETDPELNWTNHYLSFNNDPLPLVLRKLERIYNVRFEYKDNLVMSKTISSSYHNADLEEILNEISYMTGLKFINTGSNSIKIK